MAPIRRFLLRLVSFFRSNHAEAELAAPLHDLAARADLLERQLGVLVEVSTLRDDALFERLPVNVAQ